MGIQQHSYPSHSMHFVLPAAPPSGLTIEEMVLAAAEPGPLRSTSVACEKEHILFVGWLLWFALRCFRVDYEDLLMMSAQPRPAV